MITLHEALDRLLHQRPYRQAFLEGRWSELELAPDDLSELETVDRQQLSRAAEGIVRDLLQRKHRGCGGLAAAFEESISAWLAGQEDPTDLLSLGYAFVEAPEYRSYRELSVGAPGLCLEEAFYRFARRKEIAPSELLEREYLRAAIKAVCMEEAPGFALPSGLERRGDMVFAMQHTLDRDVAFFCCIGGRITEGRLPLLVARLIEAQGASERLTVALSEGISPLDLTRLEAGLRRQNLLGDSHANC